MEIDIKSLRLKSIDLAITSSCNLRCKHCYLADLKNANITIRLPKIMEILTDANELGADHVTLTGGEPTIHPEFFKILDFAKSLGYKITIFTNATLIDKEFAAKLSKYDIEVIQVSLEGLREHHDAVRGKGMFDKTVSGIKNLVENNIRVTVNTQLTKGILDTIKEYVAFLKSLGVSKLLLTIPAAAGEAKANNISFPDDRIEEVRKLLRINKMKDELLSMEVDDTPKRTCSALIHQLAINFDGTVYPCHYFRSIHQYSLGNVYVERLRDIYLSWVNSDAELIRYHKYGVSQCNSCPFKTVCGACAGRIFSLYKSFSGPDLLYCRLFGKELMPKNIVLSQLVWGRDE